MMIPSERSEEINHKRPRCYKEIRIGTWSVLTPYKGGAPRNLEKMMHEYKEDIIALQGIRWGGQGT